MIAGLVAGVVLLGWTFMFAACRIAAPSNPIEQKFDDDAQMEYLRQHRRH